MNTAKPLGESAVGVSKSDKVFHTTPCSNTQGLTDRFAGATVEELLVIEVCAGSARLTKTCRKFGLRDLAMDKSTDRSCGIDIITAEQDKLLLVFIAPPCGTASRARGRPIKASLLNGRKAPQPLRSDLQPYGKGNLTGTEKLKTELANQL